MPGRPTIVAQITDCHVVEPGGLLAERVDTATMLKAAVAHLNALRPRPDVVLATGDLVNDGRPEQYAHLAEILAALELPLVALPGNHDDRTLLRATFPTLPPGGPDDPIDVVVDDHRLRLVCLDTTVPGEMGGRLRSEQLRWLDECLAAAPDRPTLIAQHHPPFTTGIEWMDATGLADPELEAEIVARHPHVVAVVCGHVHRVIAAPFGGRLAACSASTGAQVALALDGTPTHFVDETPSVAIHRWSLADGFVTHTSPIGGPPPWLPAWADPL